MPRQMKDRYLLRLPDGWRDALKKMAAESRRSVNAEVLSHLEPHVVEAMAQDAPNE